MLVIMGSSLAIGQLSLSDVDQRVIDVYGESRVQQMLVEQPEFIAYMNYYVQNAYSIAYDIPTYKLENFEDISTLTNSRTGDAISAEEIDSLNVLLLSITRGNEEYLTYKVGETGTVIIFISPKFLVEQYNDWKKAGGKL